MLSDFSLNFQSPSSMNIEFLSLCAPDPLFWFGVCNNLPSAFSNAGEESPTKTIKKLAVIAAGEGRRN